MSGPASSGPATSGPPHAQVMPDPAGICDQLAPWVPVTQDFPSQALPDPSGELRRLLADARQRGDLGELNGARVAVAVGSRGIAGLPALVEALVVGLRDAGADPFIVPSMGSHGGGSAKGQVALLASLGVTPERVGAPIRSSMETITVGVAGGVDVHVDKLAATEADAIIPLARIKPHTDFRGPVESGILKMLAIGLGKHRGADSMHRVPPEGLSDAIAAAGALIIEKTPVVAAVAVIEDAYDNVGRIEIVPGRDVTRREPELLRLAMSWMPSLPFDDVDILVVQEIGKNISGPGMDPNITGRFYAPRPDALPRVRVLVVLSLTEASHGNATGLGMADVVTYDFARSIDWKATYTNEVASRMLAGPKLPLVAADDQDALAVAAHCLGLVAPAQARVAWIKNTLSLSRIRLSEPLWQELSGDPRLTAVAAGERPRFDGGRLVDVGF